MILLYSPSEELPDRFAYVDKKIRKFNVVADEKKIVKERFFLNTIVIGSIDNEDLIVDPNNVSFVIQQTDKGYRLIEHYDKITVTNPFDTFINCLDAAHEAQRAFQ